MNKWIIKCLKNSIAEKGNYCYSLPVETTKAVIKELNRLNNIIDELERKRTEALEYIDGFYYPDERQLTHEFDGWNLAKLYDILNKGDNNE